MTNSSNADQDQIIDVTCAFTYRHDGTCRHLIQIVPGDHAGQRVEASKLTVSQGEVAQRIPGEAGIGYRHWVVSTDVLRATYAGRFAISRPAPNIGGLQATPLEMLGADIVSYLMPSRYCDPDPFLSFTATQFGDVFGGEQIAAICAWIKDNIAYTSGASDLATDAKGTFDRRAGVCRDMAHVLIAMARAVSIPARYASVYAPDVDPQDFHAVAEVYLDGAWHLVDPTGMSTPRDCVIIGVGRDAADVAFLTSFGLVNFEAQTVDVRRVRA